MGFRRQADSDWRVCWSYRWFGYTTPAAGFADPWSALLIGFLCVLFCYGCIEITKRYKLDDALDVWAVHGMGGFAPSVLVSLPQTKYPRR